VPAVPTVTIDGQQVAVADGATILDAARQAGVWIPTLCYHPAVSAQATCRLCMVELDRGGWTQMVTACNYPVRRDITVSVSSPAAVKARRGVMHLLLARAPDSEPLKALARRMGVSGTPYPTVTTAQRDCILCGLCTAVCEEVLGRAAIGFADRGTDRAVCAPFRQPSDACIACGACAAVCPVGTIRVRVHPAEGEVEISPFKSRAKLQPCERCGRPVVSVPVLEEALKKVKVDWEEVRRRARLCPACRRQATAATLAAASTDRPPSP
jgi:predicted molibdopterin-dependent oxidoreductase YjgC